MFTKTFKYISSNITYPVFGLYFNWIYRLKRICKSLHVFLFTLCTNFFEIKVVLSQDFGPLMLNLTEKLRSRKSGNVWESLKKIWPRQTCDMFPLWLTDLGFLTLSPEKSSSVTIHFGVIHLTCWHHLKTQLSVSCWNLMTVELFNHYKSDQTLILMTKISFNFLKNNTLRSVGVSVML